MHALGPETPTPLETIPTTVRTIITCATCSHGFSFEEGEHLAAVRGIEEKIVVCPKCDSIFAVERTPEGITIAANVTTMSTAPATSPVSVETGRQPNTFKLVVLEALALGFALGATQMGGGLPMMVIACVAVLMAAFGLYAWRKL